MFYTSGTTGHPKGVPTTHEAFLTNAQNMARCLGIPADIGPELRTLISVPLFHVTGCNSQLLVAIQVGGASVIMPVLDQPALMASLATERITFMVTVPAVYALLLRRPDFAGTDVSGVRWVGYGGAPIAASLVRSLQEAFPSGRVFNGYGMTETASLMTALPHDDAVDHADSVGYAVPSVDLAIVPSGADPALSASCRRGANVTSSYWERPETTAETIIDGWLHTGDVVRVDPAGRVHIVDRTKDIIIRGGENISSIEVEAALVGAPGVLGGGGAGGAGRRHGREGRCSRLRGARRRSTSIRSSRTAGSSWPISRCPSTSASPARRCSATPGRQVGQGTIAHRVLSGVPRCDDK